MQRLILLAVLATCACAGNREPERAIPVCLVGCEAPPASAVIGDVSIPATLSPTTAGGVGGRVVVSGAELNRIASRRVTLWVRVDSAGLPEEIRVAQSSGSLRTDRELVQGVRNRRLQVERAGWYRARVEPPTPR